MEDGEKEDRAREEEQAKALWAEVTKKKKQRRGQKVEKPEAFTANFFKGLEIYQTKLLVSTSPWPCPDLSKVATDFVSPCGSLSFLTFSFFLFLSWFICLFLLCWRKRKRASPGKGHTLQLSDLCSLQESGNSSF